MRQHSQSIDIVLVMKNKDNGQASNTVNTPNEANYPSNPHNRETEKTAFILSSIEENSEA